MPTPSSVSGVLSVLYEDAESVCGGGLGGRMGLIEAAVYGLVQGLAEFLPISSSRPFEGDASARRWRFTT